MTLLAGLLAAAGCGDGGGPTAVVAGTVTYNGVPVEDGSIQFTPKDGKGAVTGTFVVGGAFRAGKVPLGVMTVFVSAGGGGPGGGSGPVSTEDLARAAKKKQAAKRTAAAPAVGIPADAVGNNATFEVKAGANTLALDLMPPGNKPSKP